MFEKYDIDELYTCTVREYGPFAIENVGGCISIFSDKVKSYETIVQRHESEDHVYYTDIFHLIRFINVIDPPFVGIPRSSAGGKLYVLDTESLIKYSEFLPIQKRDSKTLQCMFFGKRRLLKK